MASSSNHSLAWLIAAVVATALLVVSGWFGVNIRHRGGQSTLTGCKSNLKNMATALEMYAEDNNGCYPKDWKAMTAGKYLKAVPTCPEAHRDTYTDYQALNQGKVHAFSFSCVGDNHHEQYTVFPRPSTNYPRYNSDTGLGDHP